MKRLESILFKQRFVIINLLLLILFSCTKKDEETPVPDELTDEEIIKIPVVVHILYNKQEYNISNEKIASQIAVLNQDFRKKNLDNSKTPSEFASLVADVGIEFELAKIDPNGKPTSGITRTLTDVNGWDGRNMLNDKPIEELKLYFNEKGGQDAWPADRFLNIWVAELTNRKDELGLPGYTNLLGSDSRIDGIVVDPRVFGTIPPLVDGHHLGRTVTHEVGHWLNLMHIFGITNNCQSTDSVDDTPPSGSAYLGNPVHPQMSCGYNNMFMNFMDYVNDDAMYMFTEGQKKRMRAVFAPGGFRYNLYKNIKSE